MGFCTLWRFSLMHKSKNIVFLSHEPTAGFLFLLIFTFSLLFFIQTTEGSIFFFFWIFSHFTICIYDVKVFFLFLISMNFCFPYILVCESLDVCIISYELCRLKKGKMHNCTQSESSLFPSQACMHRHAQIIRERAAFTLKTQWKKNREKQGENERESEMATGLKQRTVEDRMK